MLVFPLVENVTSETFFAGATVPIGQQSVRNKAQQGGKGAEKSKTTVIASGKKASKSKLSRNQVKKEVALKKTYSEEPVVKDSLWNIYNGNPGYFVTEGDTVNFGTVTTLSDTGFVASLRTIVPTTIKPYGIVGKELKIPNQDWILGIILILWIIFASVRVGFMKYLSQLFVSLINFSAATRLYRQIGYRTMFGAVRLDLIFYLILPLSAFQIARFYGVDIPGYPAILFFIGLLLIINGYFFIKILLYKMAGSIVMLKEQTDESIFNIRLYYKALGLLLLPIVTLHAIVPETRFIMVWIMAGLIVIMYIATAFRSIYLGSRKGISILYLILYLCTLEILPLLLIFKLMSAE